MGTFSIWHWLIILLLFGVPIFVVYRLLAGPTKRRTGTAESPPAHRSPLDILEERFARGEIDEEEFEARRRKLEN